MNIFAPKKFTFQEISLDRSREINFLSHWRVSFTSGSVFQSVWHLRRDVLTKCQGTRNPSREIPRVKYWFQVCYAEDKITIVTRVYVYARRRHCYGGGKSNGTRMGSIHRASIERRAIRFTHPWLRRDRIGQTPARAIFWRQPCVSNRPSYFTEFRGNYRDNSIVRISWAISTRGETRNDVSLAAPAAQYDIHFLINISYRLVHRLDRATEKLARDKWRGTELD